jgi:hypothetical protein
MSESDERKSFQKMDCGYCVERMWKKREFVVVDAGNGRVPQLWGLSTRWG